MTFLRTARLALGLACLTGLAALPGQAAQVHSDYVFDAQTGWQVHLSLTHDGTPAAAITDFTVFFDAARFADLQLLDAPAGWDSLVIAPSTTLPAPGFLDALALTPADALQPGAALGGFRVGFTLLGGGVPGALAYDIVDAQFRTLESGLTSATVSVPEPAVAALWALGLLGLAANVAQRRRAQAGSAR